MTNPATIDSGVALTPGTRVHQVMFGGLGGHSSVGLSFVLATPHLEHSVTFFGVEPPSLELTERFAVLGARCTSVQKRGGLDLRSLASVVRDISIRAPDGVVMHSSSTGLAVIPACRARRIPVLCVDHTPTDAKEPREWWALGLGIAAADATVFLTPQAEKDARARFGLLMRHAECRMIPNGIDVTAFAPGAGRKSGQKTLTMLSRFAPLRDHASLVSAVALVLEESPDLRPSLRVILAGHGPTHEAVAEHVARAGVDDVVELPGMLDETSVVRLLQETDVYVHSSLAETMSTAVMQAMSTGLPTIATDIPGMDFLIDDGRTGLLVPPRDVRAMASAIASVLRDDQRARALGAAAREAALHRFSSTSMADGYQALIGQLIGGER